MVEAVLVYDEIPPAQHAARMRNSQERGFCMGNLPAKAGNNYPYPPVQLAERILVSVTVKEESRAQNP
jgi:hypothetical protein